MPLTRKQGKEQRAKLMKEIAREERKTQRGELARLVLARREAWRNKHGALKRTRQTCRQARLALRTKLREIRAALLAALKQNALDQRMAARARCDQGIAEARELGETWARAKAKHEHERRYRRDMRRIARDNRARRKELAPRRMARQRARESDEEVLANIPPELTRLWHRVGSRIRGSARQSRTEAFLHYAEEHPAEVLDALEDKSDALVRELQAKEDEARRALKKAVPKQRIKDRLAAAVGADDVPF